MPHQWPTDGSCVFGPWMLKTAREGTQKPIQYRVCVHPQCHESQTREAPNG